MELKFPYFISYSSLFLGFLFCLESSPDWVFSYSGYLFWFCNLISYFIYSSYYFLNFSWIYIYLYFSIFSDLSLCSLSILSYWSMIAQQIYCAKLNSTWLFFTNLVMASLQSYILANYLKRGIKSISYLSFGSSYQLIIGMAHSGCSIYADGELSRMIASFMFLPILDISFVNTPFK